MTTDPLRGVSLADALDDADEWQEPAELEDVVWAWLEANANEVRSQYDVGGGTYYGLLNNAKRIGVNETP